MRNIAGTLRSEHKCPLCNQMFVQPYIDEFGQRICHWCVRRHYCAKGSEGQTIYCPFTGKELLKPFKLTADKMFEAKLTKSYKRQYGLLVNEIRKKYLKWDDLYF